MEISFVFLHFFDLCPFCQALVLKAFQSFLSFIDSILFFFDYVPAFIFLFFGIFTLYILTILTPFDIIKLL